jgi:hypothetical protein
MVRTSLVAACAAFTGLSNAAALGSAEEYADGTVHGRIMAMKMVCLSTPPPMLLVRVEE